MRDAGTRSAARARLQARTARSAAASSGRSSRRRISRAGLMPALSELEFGLILLGHAFDRWMVRCMAAAGVADLSALDVLVLHTVNHRDRPKRLADICLVLNIEDTHLVTYAVKKLQAHGLVASGRQRQGKDRRDHAERRGDVPEISRNPRGAAGEAGARHRASTSASSRRWLARCVHCPGTTIRRRASAASL